MLKPEILIFLLTYSEEQSEFMSVQEVTGHLVDLEFSKKSDQTAAVIGFVFRSNRNSFGPIGFGLTPKDAQSPRLLNDKLSFVLEMPSISMHFTQTVSVNPS